MLTRDCYAKEKREEKFCLSSLPGTSWDCAGSGASLEFKSSSEEKKAKNPCGFYEAISLVPLSLFSRGRLELAALGARDQLQ